MEDKDLMELFHDVVEESIEFLYERTRLKYFDLFFLTVNNILAGEVLNDLSEEDIKALEKIYEPLSNDFDVEMIRKALQAIILRGFKEQKMGNGGMTPDTIGMIFAYLISKFEPKKRQINLFDPIAGVGNLLFTLLNHLDLEIDAYAAEHNELFVKIMKAQADLMDQNINIYFQNTFNVSVANMDYIVCDFDYDEIKDDKYFPYECIKHHLPSLKEDGVMLCVIPNDFFSFDKNQDFKKEINEYASIIGLIELPDEMFVNNTKSIILIQKKIIENKKCLMVKLPSFNDAKAFNQALTQVEMWFENNINKK